MTLCIYDAAGNKAAATSEQQAAARTELGAASAADLAATSATATAARAAATSAAAAAASAQATATSAGTTAASAQTAATAAQAAAAAAYVKPASGIPHSDLHQGIRDQLDLAETALQPGELPAGHPTNRYGIDIGALLPPPTVCRNYIEAVCIGCSHIAWGSIRIEPTLMSIGEAAGAIAGIAWRTGRQVHAVSSAEVAKAIGFKRLGSLGTLAVTGTTNLTGTVTQTQTYGTVTTVGAWDYENAPIGWVEGSSGCFHDRTTGKGAKTITFTPTISAIGGPGVYEVYVNCPAKWSADFTDSPDVPITVNFNGGTQSQVLRGDFLHGDWLCKLVGVFRFTGAGTENLVISNTGTTGRTRVNAVQFVRIGP